MDLWKFEDIVKSKSLYLSSLECMGDEFEGAIPSHIGKYFIENARKEYGEDAAIGWTKVVNPNNRLMKESFISSWNIDLNESFALWKIYTKDKCAIAIKTTLERLINSLASEDVHTQYIGKIKYHDGRHYSFRGNMFDPIMYKWDYYSFENELRIVTAYYAKDLKALETHPKGLRVRINVDVLIDEIYLAPYAGNSEFENINSLLNTNSLKKNIMTSGIRDKWSN